jgi:hypothetical protein
MNRLVRMLVAAALMTGAVVIYAGVAAGHGGDGDRHGRDGDRRGGEVFDSALAPSLTDDPAFHGVSPGGAPWVLRRGEVELKRRGRLELRVRGLVIPNPPGDNTPGPVTTISASLFCGADSNTTPADTTPAVPISRAGNARIRDRDFDVPATCLAPIVLVHPNGNTTRYIAVSGWRF